MTWTVSGGFAATVLLAESRTATAAHLGSLDLGQTTYFVQWLAHRPASGLPATTNIAALPAMPVQLVDQHHLMMTHALQAD